MAVAYAGIGRLAQTLLAHLRAETTALSYQHKFSGAFAVQSELRIVEYRAASDDAGAALLFGVRLIFAAGYPHKAAATLRPTGDT